MKKLSVALLVGMMILVSVKNVLAFEPVVDTDVCPLYIAKESSSADRWPIAVKITAFHLTNSTTYEYLVRIKQNGSRYGSHWDTSAESWKSGLDSYSTFGTTGTSETSLTRWVYLRAGSNLSKGSGNKVSVSFRPEGGDAEWHESYDDITVLDMTSGTGDGGWIADTGGTFALNKVILALDGSGNTIGSYRSENNSITEDDSYPTASGSFKIAVKYGTNMVQTVRAINDNETTYASNSGPWSITAGSTTTIDVTLPVTLSSFAAISANSGVILKWRTESEVDHLGWDIYRSEKKDGKFVQINDELIPGAGNSAMPNTYQFVDKTAIKGRQYYYYLEDVDMAGTRNKSSIITTSKDAGKLTTTWSKIKKG